MLKQAGIESLRTRNSAAVAHPGGQPNGRSAGTRARHAWPAAKARIAAIATHLRCDHTWSQPYGIDFKPDGSPRAMEWSCLRCQRRRWGPPV